MNSTTASERSIAIQKQKLMSAIREIVFREKKDFNDISVIDICKKARVSRRSFYRYYSGKFDLMHDMIEYDLNGFKKLIDDIIRNPVTPAEKLKLLQKQLLQTFSEDFTDDVIEHFRLEAPEFWEINVRRYSDILDMFSKVVEEGIRDGSFKRDTNPHLVVFMLLCASDTTQQKRFLGAEQYNHARIIEKSVDIILNGISNA